MITFKSARCDELALGSDGNEYPGTQIEVIDLATGKMPVDEKGRTLQFKSVDCESGTGLAFDNHWNANDHKDRYLTILVRRNFALRLREEKTP